MKTYEYIGDEPRNFPTLGRELKKGDTIDSEEDLNSPFLVEVKPKKGADK